MAAAGLNLFESDFEWPVMVLRERSLGANIAAMADYCARHGVSLAPHGKIALSPDLYRRQEQLGAWGVSVATPYQARVFRAGGARRVLLANELVHGGFAAWIQRELAADPGFAFLCYVDSVAGVRLLEQALDPDLPALPVLVEIGHHGGRTGCRTPDAALEVAAAAHGTAALSVVGVAGYEGSVSHGRDSEALAQVRAYLHTVRSALALLAEAGLLDPDAPEYVASAGGSLYFDLVAEVLSGWDLARPVRTVLRSGAYLTHDDGLYARLSPGTGGPFRPAIEVWSQVLSVPEPGLALLDAGRRDLSFDQGLPVPHTHRTADGPVPVHGWTVEDLNDQHLFLRTAPGAEPGVGDLVGFGISHPCTAHDKWQLVPIVDDDYRVVDTARCYF
ncbi:alanine racemase [Peterkaempfera bronchialis]|uniref:alanine racemase n=1 Tax=Peterkaempfera bronchialis TaxID=2126346 RepID=UPI001E5CDB3A|nr:alanine racemase [Peterkaempfera bronchialis]